MIVLRESKTCLKKAVSALKNGGVVICPTDTVYGFLADAGNKKAVEEIYKIKKRARSKPLPVFARDIKMAKQIAEIETRQEKILRKYWPGKYTFVLFRKKYKESVFTNQPPPCGATGCPVGQAIELVNGTKRVGKGMSAGKLYGVGEKTIAIRIPKYRFLNDLLKKINRPLAQTSVNISGESPLTKIEDIKTRFAKVRWRSGLSLLLVDGGDLKKAKPSKIIDLTTRHLTRIR